MVNPLSLLNVFAATNCYQQFLGLRPWNFYLQMDDNCQVQGFVLLGSHSSILLVLLALVDDLFRIIGLLAVIFIIYAGVQFILSSGKPDEAAKARTTGINALVGLGISVVATAFVSFLGAQVDNRSGGKNGNLQLFALPNPTGIEGAGLIQTGLSLAFNIIGAVAFLVIVIAGMQYVLSQGDPQTTKRAKDMVIYALVGLVLAIVAQSIVSFAVHYRP